jgi:hypothetical protein
MVLLGFPQPERRGRDAIKEPCTGRQANPAQAHARAANRRTQEPCMWD